jgi:dienelactone hydrolase
MNHWESEREKIRAKFWELLGDLPPLFTPQPLVLERTMREGCIVHKIAFDNGAGAQVYGYLLFPPRLKAPAPAVLYHHVHGGKYDLGKDELFRPRDDGRIPGPALVEAGYIVLAIDCYCFGERQSQGPLGEVEAGAATEQALFKHFLWRGSSLWGMIVRDDLLALNYLLSRPEVDPERIGVTGMSLGGSRTTWMGALDDRPRVIVPVAQMTRYQNFAATGRYNLHSIYYYVPNMLKSSLDMEHLVALAAPCPQAILIGDSDPLSPIEGVHQVVDYARRIYQQYDAADDFTTFIEPGAAHQYTPAMFTRMLDIMKQYLKPR